MEIQTSALPRDHYEFRMFYTEYPKKRLQKYIDNLGCAILTSQSIERKIQHASCIGIDETPRKRIVLVKHFPRAMHVEEKIAWAWGQRSEFAPLGYRPIIESELIDIALRAKGEAFLQGRRHLVALGTMHVLDERRYALYLTTQPSLLSAKKRRVGRINIDGKLDWERTDRYIFVVNDEVR